VSLQKDLKNISVGYDKKILLNYLPIQHSSFEHGVVLVTSGGSTPI